MASLASATEASIGPDHRPSCSGVAIGSGAAGRRHRRGLGQPTAPVSFVRVHRQGNGRERITRPGFVSPRAGSGCPQVASFIPAPWHTPPGVRSRPDLRWKDCSGRQARGWSVAHRASPSRLCSGAAPLVVLLAGSRRTAAIPISPLAVPGRFAVSVVTVLLRWCQTRLQARARGRRSWPAIRHHPASTTWASILANAVRRHARSRTVQQARRSRPHRPGTVPDHAAPALHGVAAPSGPP